MSQRLPPLFFSCDWGTSSFRLRLVETGSGKILAQAKSAENGIKSIHLRVETLGPREREAAFSSFLSGQIHRLKQQAAVRDGDIPVLVSGMASSTIGWRELPYAKTPFPLDGRMAVVEKIAIPAEGGTPPWAWLISGVATDREIMRGEETEMIGLLNAPAFEQFRAQCLLVLPGTHCKHVEIAGGTIQNFRTFMTGELFQVLGEHSVLRATTHTGPAAPTTEPTRLIESFQEGIATARQKGAWGALFQARTRSILGGCPAEENRSFLSGLLIGAELAEALQKSTGPILLAATGQLAENYQLAFQELGAAHRISLVPPSLMEAAASDGHRVLLAALGLSSS